MHHPPTNERAKPRIRSHSAESRIDAIALAMRQMPYENCPQQTKPPSHSSRHSPQRRLSQCANSLWSRTLEIDPLDSTPYVSAFADEIAEVLPRDLGLGLDFAFLGALVRELLYAALQAGAELVGGEFKRAAHFVRDTRRVCVRVV